MNRERYLVSGAEVTVIAWIVATLLVLVGLLASAHGRCPCERPVGCSGSMAVTNSCTVSGTVGDVFGAGTWVHWYWDGYNNVWWRGTWASGYALIDVWCQPGSTNLSCAIRSHDNFGGLAGGGAGVDSTLRIVVSGTSTAMAGSCTIRAGVYSSLDGITNAVNSVIGHVDF